MMITRRNQRQSEAPPFPGLPEATDGSGAVVAVETLASEAAGAYPITPSTQMGEGWALAVAAGKTNVFGRRLIFFEPEGEHAAAAVTAGMSMTGLRATNFSSGQGIAYMHESLYAAAGKRLTYVLHMAARAMTKHALNVHAGHDDYHAIDDTGFFQLFAKDVQSAADLALIAHRIAELSLTPGVCAQDGFLTSHVIESVRLPEPELVHTYLGNPSDRIESPTPAQRLVFGETRRRIPEMFDFDYPAMLGVVQNQDSYAQGVAAQRPFYFDHVRELADRAMAEYTALTGRAYARARGYRIDDAEYVIVGQGSVVANAEAVADHLRESRGLKVGVLDLTMFRPFPADIVTAMLRGKKGVVVLERLDQPLAVELPLLREIRAAMSRALDNGRTKDGAEPFPELAAVHASELPDFYSGGFGFGSRDLQPGDIVAAVENMVPGGAGRRHFYLGVEFIRKNTRLPKLQIWQDKLRESYPQLENLALEPVPGVKLLAQGSLALRIHSVGGWGAITMGKNLALTAFELLGLNIKANPKYGSEKKGQPTTFYATLSPQPVRLNSELRHVDVVLSPDPNVFRHSDPLLGLARGGVFIIQSDLDDAALWASLPASAQADIHERGIRLFALDGFGIASDEASDAELRYRMQGTAFMGAFFAVSPLVAHEGEWRDRIFEGIRVQLEKKFGKLGARVVEDNLRVIRRGFDEVREVAPGEVRAEEPAAALQAMPSVMQVANVASGIGDAGRFFEQVGALYGVAQDGIADPFAAISAIPAATSAIRDMTNIRFEVPDFIAEKCTGCAQCWTQCPDAAIPGLVHSIEDVFDTAIRTATQMDRESGGQAGFDRIRQISRSLSKEAHKVLGGVPFTTFGEVASAAYRNVVAKLGWDADRRAALDDEFAAVYSLLADFPLARTAPFFDSPERREKGSGGLLSITINPEACKGCNICVQVCPEQALVTIKQDADVVDRLRRNWRLWENLPDTADRFINVSSVEEGIGVLPSLLLKKDTYRSMVGGDGACMGCGEKTTVHLVTSTIEALMQPRIARFVAKLDGMLEQLDRQARELLAADADLDAAAAAERAVDLTLSAEAKERLRRLTEAAAALKDLRWRYTEGPGGRGRAHLGISNSTGCSSVWGSTYPYNPYPYPWVNHLFQDSPSVAIGLFEGHMRKMADAFTAVRRAELLVSDEYDPAVHEPFFTAFDWHQFSDEEFGLCPPVVAIGGDGAMLDIGFQNLSRLLASGKPIRVVVLDTQVYSNTGGQACTSGFTGQVSDMAAWGAAHHGKEETRKELGLIALAHRGVFVHQSSQASASHLIAGVLKGLHARRPAVFNLYTPCPVEHGLADDQAPISAKLALESRAFPFLTYDPDCGDSIAECLSLEGNPAVEDDWPVYRLQYVDDAGAIQELELPLTIADWAATETRFRKHFKPLRDDDDAELVPFHEFVALPLSEREGKTAFIHTVSDDRKLRKLAVATEIADLARERLGFWAQLRELAAVKPSAAAQDTVADRLEAEFAARADALRAEYETRIAELRESYPRLVARRMAEGLVRAGGSERVADLLSRVGKMSELDPITASMVADVTLGNGAAPAAVAAAPRPAVEPVVAVAAAEAVSPQPDGSAVAIAEPAPDDGLEIEPYIETDRCTTCNECTNINNRMFAYNENRQAYIKDPRAGTFAQLVTAAERCSAGLIHPGTPLNPKEKNLDKWIKRAERFN